jgi:hypothetical protein
VNQLLTPGVVDQSARMPGGVLSKSLPAPAGWEKGGLAIAFYGCGEPVLRDKCVAGTDVPHRLGSVGEFPTIPIEQGVTCSTTNDSDLSVQALDRFNATADWSLSRQLQTDQVDNGQPKLDDATSLGTVTGGDFANAIGCLEAAAAGSGFGSVWVLHTTVRGASFLAQQGLMTIDGFTPAGAKVIIGTGYENPSGTAVRFWVTGQVWASIGQPDVVRAIDHQQNSVDAWARGVGVVAFDPCILSRIDVTVTACGT